MAGRGIVGQPITYLPADRKDRRRLRDVEEVLSRTGEDTKATVSVPGVEPVELTPELASILREASVQLSEGRGVTIIPRGATLTTQEAADMLGMSRPTFVKLLEEGEIPFEMVGTHRRVLLKDVEEYRARRHAETIAALDELLYDEDPWETADNPLIRKD